MKTSTIENATKAAHYAQFLCNEIRAAQSGACDSEPLLELMMRDLLAPARELRTKLELILAACHEIGGTK